MSGEMTFLGNLVSDWLPSNGGNRNRRGKSEQTGEIGTMQITGYYDNVKQNWDLYVVELKLFHHMTAYFYFPIAINRDPAQSIYHRSDRFQKTELLRSLQHEPIVLGESRSFLSDSIGWCRVLNSLYCSEVLMLDKNKYLRRRGNSEQIPCSDFPRPNRLLSILFTLKHTWRQKFRGLTYATKIISIISYTYAPLNFAKIEMMCRENGN